MIDRLEARVTYTNPTNSANKSANKLAAMAKKSGFLPIPISQIRAQFFRLLCLFLCIPLAASLGSCGVEAPRAKKPAIYLYPTKTTEVTVKLKFKGTLTTTYPAYDAGSGWKVTAHPDGTLVDKSDKTYSYLFWEGLSKTHYDMSHGFVIKGKDTASFLEKTLSTIGLDSKQRNDFITFWLPQMQNNPYNLISFQSKAYTDSAVLEISPKPDSILRVFMAYKRLEQPISVPQQTVKPFVHKGFTVIEWGGTNLAE